jgi:hypothetical protein
MRESKRARTSIVKGVAMIANPAIPFPGAVPQPFTLNDLRVHDTLREEAPAPTSKLSLYGMGLAVILAIGAFMWLDPMHLFTPTEESAPAPAAVPSALPARTIEKQEIIAPLTPVPATKSLEAPIAPAPVVQAPQVQAPVVQRRAASAKPESRAIPIDKAKAVVPQAVPMEPTAPPMLLSKPAEPAPPPALLTKPEEKTDMPIVPKLVDDTKIAPIPAATTSQAPVTE